MMRCLAFLVFAAFMSLTEIAAAHPASDSRETVKKPKAIDCTAIRRDASKTAPTISKWLKGADAETQREILQSLLMSQDAAALFSCLKEGRLDTESKAKQNVFSKRTGKVGVDKLNRYERKQLSRTLDFIGTAGVSSAADPDCIIHDDGSVTCLKEGAWICFCDPPGTSGGECGCANF